MDTQNTFFNQAGCSISCEDFICLYSAGYYNDNPKVEGFRYTQSSRFVEDEIDCLLTNGIKTETDVVHILAWKIGKIRHTDSKSDFVYHSDWKDAENLKVKRYGKDFPIHRLATYIVNNIGDLEEQAQKNPQKVLNLLKENGINGIGTVYYITLLYFISRGRIPIYDRFAAISLKAYKEAAKPGSEIIYQELPSKNESAFETVYEDRVVPYIKDIEDTFGEEYWKTRDTDRALWVYGHNFRSKSQGNSFRGSSK